MGKRIALLFAVALFAQAGNLILIDHQHSVYRIAAPPKATEPERFAAEELGKYLNQIGNAALPFEKAKGPALHVGVRTAEVDRALEGRKEDSFVILTAGADIYLTGNTPRATLYSVYYFLEKFLGCGWLQPGDDAVPKREVAAVPDFIRDVQEPAFSHRSLNLYRYFPKRAVPRVDWAAKNRLNWVHVCTNGSNHWEAFDSRNTFVPEVRKRGLRLNYGGHTFNTWVSPKTYFASHPEYFSSIDGQRNPAQLNIASPEVVRVAAANMNAFLDANPEVEMIDMWLNDTSRFDDSEEVRRMEGGERVSMFGQVTGRDLKSRSNANIRFVNSIAREIAKRHPRVLVQTLAYFQLIDAPEVKPEPNVMVGFAPISRMPARYKEDATGYWYPLSQPGHEINNRHLAEIEKWLKVVPPEHFFTYEYYSHVTTSRKMVNMNTAPGDLETIVIDQSKKGFHVYTDAIAKDIKLYSEIGNTGVGTEDWDWDELNMYVYPRLLWHPELSSDGLIADYCHRSYGAAAMPMLRHWLALQDAREHFRSTKPECLRYLQEAKQMALPADELGRIRMVEETWTHIE